MASKNYTYEGLRLFEREFFLSTLVSFYHTAHYLYVRISSLPCKICTVLPRSVKNSSKELPFHRCFVVVLDCIGLLHEFYMNHNVIEYRTVPLHIYTG